jgi:hypothetical protein
MAIHMGVGEYFQTASFVDNPGPEMDRTSPAGISVTDKTKQRPENTTTNILSTIQKKLTSVAVVQDQKILMHLGLPDIVSEAAAGILPTGCDTSTVTTALISECRFSGAPRKPCSFPIKNCEDRKFNTHGHFAGNGSLASAESITKKRQSSDDGSPPDNLMKPNAMVEFPRLLDYVDELDDTTTTHNDGKKVYRQLVQYTFNAQRDGILIST